MRLGDLLTRLPEENISDTMLADPDCEVYNVSFLTGEAAHTPRGDVLYFSDSVLLPKAVPDCRLFSCVVVDGSDGETNLAGQPNVNLIWLAPGADLFACYNSIQAAFLEDQELSSIVNRLLEAHFSNQGLQYLVEEAAIALGNPIVVVDPAYRYNAYHLGNLHEEDSRLSQVLTTEIVNEGLLDEGVAYIRDARIDSEIARSKGPLEQYNSVLECNTMTLAVMVNGVCVAHVMMIESAHPFGDLDREVFVRLANFVGQELQKSEVWGPTSGELGSRFLEYLLNDRSPSDAVTRRRMKALNFHPKPILYVVCLHADGEGLDQLQAERVAAQLRPMLHHSLYTRHHQQLVMLISRDVEVGFSEHAERKIREIATLNGLTAGVSNLFETITETRTAYAQARAAIRYGQAMTQAIDDGCLWRYGDVSYAQMIEVAGRRQNLLNFCHPALLRLLRYDDAHSGELMETLFCYLQVAGSTARAAKLLNLHKNTMLYRLGRIRAVLGMNLASGEDLFLLQMGFRVLMSLGLFSPRMQLKREELSG